MTRAAAVVGFLSVLAFTMAVTAACTSPPASDEDIVGPNGTVFHVRGVPIPDASVDTDGGDSGAGGDNDAGDAGEDAGIVDAGSSTGDASSGGTTSSSTSSTSGGGVPPVNTITSPGVTVPGSSGEAFTPPPADTNSSCHAVPGTHLADRRGSLAFAALALGTALFARRRKK